MLVTQDFAREYPLLFGLIQTSTILFYLGVIWILGRLGDNINKIRKILEEDAKRRQMS